MQSRPQSRNAAHKRRALGQHFLKDRRACERIVSAALEAARVARSSTVLEIGPGQGALTDGLLESLRRGEIERLILSERDRGLAERWSRLVANDSALQTRVRVESGDFLELPESAWLEAGAAAPLTVVSNLPYSTGTAILTRLARHPAKIHSMVLMFQAEVAQRLRAQSETKDWGSLSIWIQNRWDVSKLLSVSPGAFSPPPAVDSEVVVLNARAQPRIAVEPSEEDRWEKLLRAAFAHRRKMLRSGFPRGFPYENTLELSGVDGTKRAEALSWEEWNRLWEALLHCVRQRGDSAHPL